MSRAALGRLSCMDRFDLYELCVTEPVRLARFVRAVHGKNPRALREDFSGTGALAREWARSDVKAEAVAVDVDAEPLRRVAGVERVRAVKSRVERCRVKADVIACTNFPLGYWHTRRELVAYLAHARRCLNRGGVLIADTYGGRDAFERASITQKFRGPSGEQVEYTFEQRDADAGMGRVVDVLHFRVWPKGRGARARVFRDAFVYDWRLWSIPELRDAMDEAGFSAVEVHDRLGDAVDGRGRLMVRAMSAGDGLDENYVVYLAARR